ncbi:MAG: ABC-2 family transporter protein [Chloroflexi bacterium]|nr:ABC-2 family transporter protein [Chloroflexota bacterium]
MAYYAELYVVYVRCLFKAWSQYRADFAITFVSSILHTGSSLVFLTIIFASIRQLEGWSFHEVLLIWGLITAGTNVANGVLDVPHRILYYIQSGELDRLLVRPPAPLFQIAGEGGITLPALGRVLVGVAAIATALAALPTPLPWWGMYYLLLAILSGTLIMFSVQLLMACLSFWYVSTFSLMQTMGWMNQFGRFPVNIFGLPLQFLFTWIVPYAMMGFYPAAFLLRGDEYQFYGLLAPLMGWLFLGLSLLVWRVAIRHYQSTGS